MLHTKIRPQISILIPRDQLEENCVNRNKIEKASNVKKKKKKKKKKKNRQNANK